MQTERIKLGTGLAVAFSRSPFEAANAAADIDEMSGGRMIFGLGTGAPELNATVHSAFVEGNLDAVRLTMAGEFTRCGEYSNEYCVCVETRGAKIAKVWEYLDVAHAEAQMRAARITATRAGS